MNLFRSASRGSNAKSGGCSPVAETSPGSGEVTSSFSWQSDEDDGTPLTLSTETSFSGLCFAEMVQSRGEGLEDYQQTFKHPDVVQQTLSLNAICDVPGERGRSIEEQMKDAEFVWVDVAAQNLEAIEDIELMRALRRRNENKDGVPEWLAKGLKEVKGPVDWLLKIRVPEGLKKGRKVVFKVGGVRVEARYGGKKSAGGFEVFALQSRENKVKDRGFVWVSIPAEHVEKAKDIDLMRALERRNHGIKEEVPEWMLQGLAEVRANVDWLLSVKIPPGVKKGRKIAFVLHGEKVKAVYNGDGKEPGGKAVFALLSRTTGVL